LSPRTAGSLHCFPYLFVRFKRRKEEWGRERVKRGWSNNGEGKGIEEEKEGNPPHP